MPMRVLAICPRFGGEIPGGAERLARDYSLRLAARGYQVTVATTSASDYRSWADDSHYPAGAAHDGSEENPVIVRRFSVPRPRNPWQFAMASKLAFRLNHPWVSRWWMKSQGPWSPALAAWVARNADRFDAVLVFGYLYATTFATIASVADRAILVPMAHDEPPLGLSLFDDIVRQPKHILVCSPTEDSLLRNRFRELPAMSYAGAGVDLPTEEALNGSGAMALSAWLLSQSPRLAAAAATGKFFLVQGRLAVAKDTDLVARDYTDALKIVQSRGGNWVPLALVGPLEMSRALFPSDDAIIVSQGPVPEAARPALVHRALATLHGSRHESLNLAALESLSCGTPIVAHDRSKATLDIAAAIDRRHWTWSNPQQLADRMREFQADDTTIARAGVRMTLRQVASTTYPWDAAIDRVEAAIAHAAGKIA